MRKLSIVAAMLLLAPSISQAKTLEDLLVQKGVITKGEASAASSSSASKVYWNDGTRLEFPDSGVTTKINTFIETRYTFDDRDEGTGNTSSFDVHSARIIMSGTALHNEFAYYLQADLVGSSDSTTGAASPTLLDAYVQWNVCDWASVRMGQFKTFLGRDYVTSEWNRTFADSSVASNYHNLGRQQGAAGAVNFMDGQLEFKGGAFNGNKTGEGQNLSNTDTRHSGVVAARYNIGKIDPYVQTDFDRSKDFGASMGVAYGYTEDTTDESREVYNVDTLMKYQGWSLGGELFGGSDDVTDADTLGGYVQGAYLFEGSPWELAARWGYIDCDSGTAGGECSGNDVISEWTAGINYYWLKNNLKAQLAYTFNYENLTNNENDQRNEKYVFQLSSYF